MSRALDDLDPRFRPLAIELLARCVEAQIMVMIVDTLRTKDEQAAYVAKGVSWTMNSKHLLGLAMDICPYDVYLANGPDKLQWDERHPLWPKIGAIGRRLGLKWGIVKNGTHMDLGHFEYIDTGSSGIPV
jgi:hypothetical protein